MLSMPAVPSCSLLTTILKLLQNKLSPHYFLLSMISGSIWMLSSCTLRFFYSSFFVPVVKHTLVLFRKKNCYSVRNAYHLPCEIKVNANMSNILAWCRSAFIHKSFCSSFKWNEAIYLHFTSTSIQQCILKERWAGSKSDVLYANILIVQSREDEGRFQSRTPGKNRNC